MTTHEESDRVAQEFGGLIDDYAQFMSLVAEMRKCQRNYYKEKPILGAKVAYKNMINKEYKVDKWLEEHYDSRN